MASAPPGRPRPPEGLVVGAKAVLRAAAAAPVRRVIVATDAPAAATEPVRRLAADRAVPLVEVPSSVALGLVCGLRRPVAAAAEMAPFGT
jgi:ribosomal protein L7Ae-like RNA K-turn-binding protein